MALEMGMPLMSETPLSVSVAMSVSAAVAASEELL